MSRQLTKRERLLSMAVGGIAAVFLNVLVVDYFVRNQARLRTELASRSKQLRTMQTALAEKPIWEEREAWLRAKQPKITDDDTAGGELLRQVRALAKKHSVVLVTEVFRLPVRRHEYTAIAVDIDAQSSWKSLIGFLAELQTPEQFIVFENANLNIDPADQTQMHGKFRIAKWFAPQ